MKKVKIVWEIIRDTTVKFYEGNMLNYSASVAFFTIFSLPGILIVTIMIAGMFFSRTIVNRELFDQIKSVVGPKSAIEIHGILENISSVEPTYLTTLIGVGTILFGATSVFVTIQDGLNASWGLRAKPKIFALKFIINRLLSFAMVVSIGFIMLVSLAIDALMVLFQDFLVRIMSGQEVYIIELLNRFFSILIIAIVFLLIYRFLPSGKANWRYLLLGTFASTVLFILGKYLIGLYLGNSTLGTAYGAAGSLVVLLIWVYYSSVVLLFGAELVVIASRKTGHKIIPKSQTVKIVTKEI